jgi:uncharacterized damage-inducible protein DinB
MAAYNAEMNRRIFREASTLSDEQRKADRGIFWKSIHATLVHIYWADRIWMWRLAGWERPEGTLKESGGLIDIFSERCNKRIETDAGIDEWAGTVTEPYFAEEHVWFNRIRQVEMHHSYAFLTMHLFTHQIHHRGHVHGVLTAFGVETADTDLWAVVEPVL